MMLVETNALIYFFAADRAPNHAPAKRLFGHTLDHALCAAITVHAVTTVEFLLMRTTDRTHALRAVDWVLANIEIAPVNRAVLIRARFLG